MLERGGAERDAWVSEDLVPGSVLVDFYRQLGLQRLAQKARKVKQKKAAARDSGEIAPIPVGQRAEASDEVDLQAVSCNTHKEVQHGGLLKTAGMLVACLSSGIIVSLREFFGCESLSQRYLAISNLRAHCHEMKLLVHDDACHVHRYCARRQQARYVSKICGSGPPVLGSRIPGPAISTLGVLAVSLVVGLLSGFKPAVRAPGPAVSVSALRRACSL